MTKSSYTSCIGTDIKHILETDTIYHINRNIIYQSLLRYIAKQTHHKASYQNVNNISHEKRHNMFFQNRNDISYQNRHNILFQNRHNVSHQRGHNI
jgi:hypothetical protein